MLRMTMQSWNVELTSSRLPAGVDLGAFADELMTALEADPLARGVVVSADLRERTVSPLFDIEAESVHEAVECAEDIAGEASRRAGQTIEIVGVVVSAVEALIPA